MRLTLLLCAVLLADCPARGDWRARPDWQAWFKQAGTQGTLLLYDLEQDRWQFSDSLRAQERFLPASTFKIPNSLIALETGVLKDEREWLPWDGVTREIEDWNRPHRLRGALRFSVVPVYQDFARRIGAERMADFLHRLDYGNADMGGGLDQFWLDGDLRISAVEQIEFLARLAGGELPLSERSQRIVREALIGEAGPGWLLRAKTGWAARVEPQIGWWVGWVEREERTLFFACNLEIKDKGMLALRQSLVRQALADEGILPAKED